MFEKYTIGTLSRVSGVNLETIGYYEGISLLNKLLRCWRAFKTDQLRVLNFDQTFMDVDYYTTVDKSTKLTGS